MNMSDNLTRSLVATKYGAYIPEGEDRPYILERLLDNNEENWKSVKRWVDNNDHLDINISKDVTPINAGKHGKEDHLLELYDYTFPEKYPFITVTYSWSRCNKCDKVRWIKKAAWFNGIPAICYDRYLQKIED